MKYTFSLFVIVMVYTGVSLAHALENTRPNIILIMADDIAYDNNFGSYGSSDSWTPRLDKMGEQGIRFDHCYSTPKCSPSRVKLMTGRSGIRNYSMFGSMAADEKTFAQMLQGAGYKTMVAGKWQLDGKGGTQTKDAGFDSWLLWNTQLALGKRYWNPVLERNGALIETSESDYGPDLCVDEIRRFIGDSKDEPFFVYYPMLLVHSPFLPTPDSVDKEETDQQKNFSDMVRYMDKCVGRILDAVEENGLDQNTIVLFTTDNGTHRSLKYNSRGKMVTGKKGVPHDRGSHAPLIVRAPGRIEAGSVSPDIVDFSDVMPTLAEIGKAELPDVTLDGRSFWPQCLGQEGNPRDWIYQYYWPKSYSWIPDELGEKELIWVQNQRYKLYGSGLFYDLIEDREEQHAISFENRSSEQRALVEMFEDAIERMPESNKHYTGKPVKALR